MIYTSVFTCICRHFGAMPLSQVERGWLHLAACLSVRHVSSHLGRLAGEGVPGLPPEVPNNPGLAWFVMLYNRVYLLKKENKELQAVSESFGRALLPIRDCVVLATVAEADSFQNRDVFTERLAFALGHNGETGRMLGELLNAYRQLFNEVPGRFDSNTTKFNRRRSRKGRAAVAPASAARPSSAEPAYIYLSFG